MSVDPTIFDELGGSPRDRHRSTRPPRPARVRKCRVCGCTDYDCSKCVARTGMPCWWVKVDLCSACVGDGAGEGGAP